ncbi:unnamed protein product [Rotaria sordida]|uniref:Uncharacterized protein n=1 Tax=Rotaria sordida TaxID=392033 RepID=A0A818TGQ2_9BILA|nr:unnamed protein product [Rotaria sordida]CAF0998408.1 unnamed protein product [Rotaria sordida]CAF3683521.1 unnamed protein product [Rotaria sordida]CAF3691012.1 unnamed protein product [Rotaria sordida]
MGNRSSTKVEENPKTKVEKKSKTTVKQVRERIPVRGSVYRGYQPSIEFMKKTSTEKESVINDKSDNDSPTPPSSPPQNNLSEIPILSSNKNPRLYDDHPKQTTPIKEQSSSSVVFQNISNEKSITPSLIQPKISSQIQEVYVPPPTISRNVSWPHTVAASSFEKAPMVQLNYVVKPSEKNSKHIYELDNMTVMRRTSSQVMPYGSRWYDNDYNKNVKPLIVKYY